MDCFELFEILSEYLDRELDPVISEDLVRHIEICSKCFALYRTMEKTIKLSRDYYDKTNKPVPKKVSKNVFYHLEIHYRK